jgi:hypothetical protein
MPITTQAASKIVDSMIERARDNETGGLTANYGIAQVTVMVDGNNDVTYYCGFNEVERRMALQVVQSFEHPAR